jgi:hypothetical protein
MLKYLNRTLEIGGQDLSVHASAGVFHADDLVTAFVHSWPDEAAFMAGDEPAAKWTMVVELPFNDEQPEQALSDAPGGPLSGATVVSVQWPPVNLDAMKAAKNAAINAARLRANQSHFTFAGKQIAVDPLSRSDIDAAHGIVLMLQAMPQGWPGAWKAVDNTYVSIPDVPTWGAFYGAMVAAGMQNFAHAQALKAQLAAATTPEAVEAVPVW